MSHLAIPNFGPVSPQERNLEPGEISFLQPVGAGPAGYDGAYFFVEKARLDDFVFSQRVFESISHNSENQPGIEVPVFPLSSLSAELSLLDVRPTASHRTMLRIFDAAIIPDGAVRVIMRRLEFGAPGGGTVVYDAIHRLTPGIVHIRQRVDGPVTIPFVPSQAALTGLFSEADPGGRYLIDVTALDDRMRLAGFVTLTDRVTQHVEIVSPARHVGNARQD